MTSYEILPHSNNLSPDHRGQTQARQQRVVRVVLHEEVGQHPRAHINPAEQPGREQRKPRPGQSLITFLDEPLKRPLRG